MKPKRERDRSIVPAPPRVDPGLAGRQTTVVAETWSYRSGPLPEAAELARYDAVVPGAADRLLSMAEREQAHRHGVQITVVSGEQKRQARGQFYALIIALALCAAGITAICLHEEKIGAAAFGAMAVSIGAFLYERSAERKAEQQERQQRTRPGQPAPR